MGKLDLSQLYEQLVVNEQLLVVERRLDRQVDLLVHRSVLKDCIIEALTAQVEAAANNHIDMNNVVPIRKAS